MQSDGDELVGEQFPRLRKIVRAVLQSWPEHQRFLGRSIKERSGPVLESSESIARMILELEDDDICRLCEDYKWMCARLQEEEVEFRRNGRYRYADFAQVQRLVYDDAAFMDRYLRGLLLSQALWVNHASAIDFYRRAFLSEAAGGARLLEIGPGHGLLLGLAMREGRFAAIAGWDVSATSIASTCAALKKLGLAQPADLRVADILEPPTGDDAFDLVVISEVLEHLERPDVALANLHRALAPGGKIFVNVPINSPAPDHIYLLRSPGEAIALVERGGFSIIEARHFPTAGYTIERAQRLGGTISSAIIAQARQAQATDRDNR
ncbi:MAG: class I SAM-dependent methyltransferase [Alphaproteobacteria bacterium]|nr:class I SAM-dependent methyltransferase [Alphaproteobacteria bacterium]